MRTKNSEKAKLYSVQIKRDLHSFTQSINKHLLRTHNVQGTVWNSFGELKKIKPTRKKIPSSCLDKHTYKKTDAEAEAQRCNDESRCLFHAADSRPHRPRVRRLCWQNSNSERSLPDPYPRFHWYTHPLVSSFPDTIFNQYHPLLFSLLFLKNTCWFLSLLV